MKPGVRRSRHPPGRSLWHCLQDGQWRGLAARLYSDQTEAAKRESGEYLIPLKEGLIKEDHIVGSIGEVLLGKAPGRTADDEITIFDALGLAIEDVASAKYVYERAAL